MNPTKYLVSLLAGFNNIDWTFDYSDDGRVWKAGNAKKAELVRDMYEMFGEEGRAAIWMAYGGQTREAKGWIETMLKSLTVEVTPVAEVEVPMTQISMCEKLLVRLNIEGEATTRIMTSAVVRKVQDRPVMCVEFPVEFYRMNRDACKAAIETIKGAARAQGLNAQYNAKGTKFYIGK